MIAEPIGMSYDQPPSNADIFSHLVAVTYHNNHKHSTGSNDEIVDNLCATKLHVLTSNKVTF